LAVVGAEVLGAELAGFLELLGSLGRFAQVQERYAQRHPQPGFNERLVLEALVHERHGAVDRFAKRYLPAEAALLTLGPSRGENLVLDEVQDSLSLGLALFSGLLRLLLRCRSDESFPSSGLGPLLFLPDQHGA